MAISRLYIFHRNSQSIIFLTKK